MVEQSTEDRLTVVRFHHVPKLEENVGHPNSLQETLYGVMVAYAAVNRLALVRIWLQGDLERITSVT